MDVLAAPPGLGQTLEATVRQARRQTVGDLPRRTARRVPDRAAVVFGDLTWSYAELDRICNRLAHGLAGLGIGKGERVAILSRNSHAFVAVRFAVARLGAILVPINFMLGPAEVAYVLRHAGVRVLCVGDDLAETGRQAASLDSPVEHLIWLPGDGPSEAPAGWATFDDLMVDDESEPTVDLAADEPAQISYTSGTEALPKGAVLSHAALLWQYAGVLIEGEITADDVIVHALPLFHCAQLDVLLGPGIQVGATNVIAAAPRPEVVLPLIERHRASLFFAPPTVWIGLLRSPLFDQVDLGSLRKGYYGASSMPWDVYVELNRRLPSVRFWQWYGQTEIAPAATVLTPDEHRRKPGATGRPLLNVETRVVDDGGRDVAPGEVGEVVHRSPQLLLGYYRDEQRTAEAFADGWFHSGDLARVDDEGYLTIVDRKKDMIKSGGENVASREVEEVIYQLPQVAEVAVIGLPDDYWIEAVTAVVVLRAGEAATDSDVVRHCRAHLAAFKVPKRVVFVDALPKNPSGKILKRDLRERLGAR